MHESLKVYLCTFGDGPFAPRRQKFLLEAAQLNIFDEMLFFNASNLPNSFLEQHRSFMMTRQRGFGYWIWKPVVIELALEMAAPDGIVVYLDIGFTLNSNGRRRFLEYLDIALDSPYKMLSFQNIHTEYRWTKADLAHRLGVNGAPTIMNTSQLSSGFIVLTPTQSNLDLIREWKNLSVEDNYRYSDDSPSSMPNHPSFVEHRHDQSISSLLRKMRGTTITHYEVQSYAGFFEQLKPSLPAWATRLRQ